LAAALTVEAAADASATQAVVAASTAQAAADVAAALCAAVAANNCNTSADQQAVTARAEALFSRLSLFHGQSPA